MASKFYAGMKNVVQALNEMWAAFAAGPYNALPLTGGTLTGSLTVDGSAALINLSGGSSPSTGAAILGYRGSVFEFSIGTESMVLGGASSALTLHSLSNPMKFYAGASPTPAIVIDSEKLSIARDLIPSTDNSRTLGSAALAYSVVYARTGAINTSDARLKTDFRDLTQAEIAAARDIARAIGIYRWRDAVECKGSAAREHVGPTVQAVIEIMQARGLDPFNYGFICHDAWAEQTVDHPAIEARPAVAASAEVPAVLNNDGSVLVPAVPAQPGYPAIEARAAYTEVTLEAGDRYAFRYDELAMFIAAGQEARLAALEAVV